LTIFQVFTVRLPQEAGEMAQLAPTTHASEPQTDHRRVSRIPFKATSVVTETDSSRMVVAETSELSRYGCFIQTAKPYTKGTRVHIEVAEAGTTFVASGTVAYLTDDGMGVVFSVMEPDHEAILAKWLSRTPRKFERYSFCATAKVTDVGSQNEQVLITRDLSTGGCFIKTVAPLPKGTSIRVRLEHAGVEFTAVGRVTHEVPEGMGVEFAEIEPKDRAILDKWLADEKAHRY
jgi:hypothetical protein